MQRFVYKVCPKLNWEAAERDGTVPKSSDDRRDGFLHLSTADQLSDTLAKHFAGQPDLVLIQIRLRIVEKSVRWEPSLSGKVYPHAYEDVPVSAVEGVWPLTLDDDGRHTLPECLPT